ncbi:PiggyBac transposable element-derived protein 4 [Elysia marginata]|uniref:PiggyBac transposable element-derived protein 4 n=1 Tax=Elysia marginata TaxID=1093978 RepID=A0AAV4JE76_9GAST|nr:PiggyBac transposable element-derived protein 4 [Elysia marginata]
MGVLKLPERSDYWRTTKRIIFLTQFGSVMSRDRYLLIWRYLHLSNNLQEGNPDKLRPMLPHLNQVLRDMYTPYREVAIDESVSAEANADPLESGVQRCVHTYREVAIDESMIKFKGRVSSVHAL